MNCLNYILKIPVFSKITQRFSRIPIKAMISLFFHRNKSIQKEKRKKHCIRLWKVSTAKEIFSKRVNFLVLIKLNPMICKIKVSLWGRETKVTGISPVCI